MKHREKIVQMEFIDDEERVIRRLQAVYNQSLKDITRKSNALQKEIYKIQDKYNAVENEQEREILKSMERSKVYQKRYQDSLKTQVNGILDKMHQKEFKTVNEYLNECYDKAFTGNMYVLHGEGIPLIVPIDQEKVVRAVQINSKISKGLYSRLGEDVDLLKRKITAQISRGVATGMSYSQMAQQLAGYTKIGYNNAVRITRTEGHRIQQESTMDACYAARERGADVVKQWDATMDANTRESHQKVDGEIRELDERFSNSLRYPGDPYGSVSEVVNCRCVLLQRAKWALGESELERLKDRASFYGLDKSRTLEDFRKKYNIASADKRYKEIKETKDFVSLEKYLNGKYNITVDRSVKKLDFKTCRSVLEGVETVFKDFPELSTNIREISTENRGVMCCSGDVIYFNPKYFADVSGFEEMCRNCSDNGWWVKNSSPASIGVHETGHAVESLIISKCRYDYDWERVMAWNKAEISRKIVSQALKNIKKTPYGKGKRNMELMTAVSRYGATSKQEVFAEAFADCFANGENANPLSIEIRRLALEQYNRLKAGG